MRKICILLLLAGFGTAAWSQSSKFNFYSNNVQFDRNQQAHFVELKDSYQVSSSDALAFLNALLFAESGAELKLLRSESDGIGYEHRRYSVYFQNILVAGKNVVAHFRDGKLISFNGELADVELPINSFVISESAALNAALLKVGATKYKWQNKEEEAQMALIFNEPSFSYYPKAEKVIIEKEGQCIKAYKFNIYAEEPLYRADVFVNASSGKIVEELNLICTANTPGTAPTKYSGTQTITCDLTNSLYTLRESPRGPGLGVETYNCKNTTSYAQNNFTSTTASWSLSAFDQGALDAHWGAETTYDYFLNIHNRNSINNAGFKLVSFVHYSTNYANAFWDGNRMTYGDGSGAYKIFTSLDVCGHEISHGLTSNSSNLIYQNESGALNESYSDIFGACIEAYGRPTNWNWKVGEDITTNNGGLRNMSNPNLFGDPDTYGGTSWYGGTQDNGGVHTNSGVSNFWFYLLTQGGTGTNDIGNTYSVTGIGILNAGRIAFRANTVYYTSSTNYATARNLSIQAAKDLFGDCSPEMIATINAWHAVGIGNKFIPGSLAPNFSADMVTWCNVPATINFTNLTPYAAGYLWDFGDGSSVATATNAIHTYTAGGSYNVKLKANGCSNLNDSITKTAYISINIPAVPVSSNVTGCAGAPVTLAANGNNTLKWYSNAAATTAIATGSVITTGPVTTNTTFYVANTVSNSPSFGGKPTAVGGGFLANSAQWLLFDVIQTGTLNSVVVNAGGAGNRTIELRDNSNTVLNSLPVNLSSGSNTIILYFPLSPGTGYRLGLASGTANLYRSTQGVTYPYPIANCVNITGSSAGPNSYYWFYNWQVTAEDCKSALVPVAVNVQPAPSVNMNALATEACNDDVFQLSGSPAGGVFSGTGVNGTSFSAAGMATGAYTVTYTYTDNNGCAGTDAKVVQTSECTGLTAINSSANALVFPNPVRDQLSISGAVGYTALIYDVTGRIVASNKLNSETSTIELSQLAKGVYTLKLMDAKGQLSLNQKLIKE